ncbi:MAG: hypothetical protein A07HB70_00283 [uncultured archaeon A07HB70]|nr:MAG: hypothetical protein A07HB70_00283 [uncultured archaeon A07HB70]
MHPEPLAPAVDLWQPSRAGDDGVIPGHGTAARDGVRTVWGDSRGAVAAPDAERVDPVLAAADDGPSVRDAFADRGPSRHAGGRERPLVHADREADVTSAASREHRQRAAARRLTPATTGGVTGPARGADPS